MNETQTLFARARKLILNPWEGNCYYVAARFLRLRLIKGKLRYGHWTGPVHPQSRFANRRVVQHGWIELPNGQVCDPTRYTLEAKMPYLYIGPNDHYDAGGNHLRASMMKRKPLLQDGPTEKLLNTSYLATKRNSPVYRHVMELCGNPTTLTTKHAFHLGNLPLSELGPFAKPIFTWLKKIGYASVIPIDNRELVFEKK